MEKCDKSLIYIENLINKRLKLVHSILPDDLHNEFIKWLDHSVAHDDEGFESFLKYVKSPP